VTYNGVSSRRQYADVGFRNALHSTSFGRRGGLSRVAGLKTFYPVEALIISLVLAYLPYVLIRGPAARIARRWGGASPRQIS